MKTKLLALASFLMVALLAGCNTAAQLNNVRIGMTKDQVIALLGTPDSTSAQANVEYMTYYLENGADIGNSSRDRAYMVRLVDGKVESFGRFAQLFDLYNRPVTSAQPGEAAFPTTQNTLNGMMVTPTAAVAPQAGIADQIQKLKSLKDQGVITDDEFQRAKAKLLSNP